MTEISWAICYTWEKHDIPKLSMLFKVLTITEATENLKKSLLISSHYHGKQVLFLIYR